MFDPPVVLIGLAEPSLLRSPQDAADELRRLIAGEALCELHGLAHGHLRGYVLNVEHLVERETHDRAIHCAHPVYRPTDRNLAEPLIEGFALPLHTTHERVRKLIEFTSVRAPTFQELVYRTLGNVALVKH
jgi:hypothetical protein